MEKEGEQKGGREGKRVKDAYLVRYRTKQAIAVPLDKLYGQPLPPQPLLVNAVTITAGGYRPQMRFAQINAGFVFAHAKLVVAVVTDCLQRLTL